MTSASEAKVAYDGRYHAEHREAIRERKQLWWLANREDRLARQKINRKGKHTSRSASHVVYIRLQALQDSRCAACGDLPPKGLVVDHDHATGRVRGLLCAQCNWALGFARDDPNRLRRLVLYLHRASELDTGELHPPMPARSPGSVIPGTPSCGAS